MPLAPPPVTATASPVRVPLPAGTRLWRVHKQSHSGIDFNPVMSDALFGGGRFDSTSSDPYPYLYAAPEQQTALLETLARAIPFDESGERWMRRAAIGGYRISALEPAGDLALVSLLTTPHLVAACQDEWLVQAPQAEYPQTRHWGHWLRSQAPWAQGFAWPSRRNIGCTSFVLFGDRHLDGVLRSVPGTALDLDDAAGASWLNDQLRPYRISVRPPSPQRPAAGRGG